MWDPQSEIIREVLERVGEARITRKTLDRLHDVTEFVDRQAFLIFGTLLMMLQGIAFLKPTSMFYPAHDWLDSSFVLNALRGRDPGLFALDARLDTILGGIPLSALAIPDFSLGENLYVLFDPFTAFALNEAIARSVGFVGLYVLLVTYVLRDHPHRRLIAVGPSMLFALLPYWASFAHTIAFQPLLLYGILNLVHGRRRWLSWSLVLIYPLIAGFAYGGFAVLGLVLVIAVVAAIGRKPVARILARVGAAMTTVFLVSLIRPMHLIFFTDFVSHRTDWPSPETPWFALGSAGRTLSEWLRVISIGQYHMASGQWGVPIVAILTALLLLLASFVWSRYRPPSKSEFTSGPGHNRDAIHLFGLLAAIALVGLLYATELTGMTQFVHSFAIPFQVNRVLALFPLLWMLAFALSVALVARRPSTSGRLIAGAFTLLAVFQGVWTSHSVVPRLETLIGQESRFFPTITRVFSPLWMSSFAFGSSARVADYYQQDDYRALAEGIGEEPDQLTVVSLKIDPMIAAFNGFNTLDGYVPNYPLEYKRRFRGIIEGELARSPALASYFDDWGSRVYLFHEDRPDGTLYLDFCAASDLGAQFAIAPRDIAAPRGLRPVVSAGELTAFEIASPCRA